MAAKIEISGLRFLVAGPRWRSNSKVRKNRISGLRFGGASSLALDLRGRLPLRLRVFAGALASRWRSKLQVVRAKIQVSDSKPGCGSSLALDFRVRMLMRLRVFAGALASRCRQELPGAVRSCQEPARSCQELPGASQELPGVARSQPGAARSCQELARSCQELPGAIPGATRSCQERARRSKPRQDFTGGLGFRM